MKYALLALLTLLGLAAPILAADPPDPGLAPAVGQDAPSLAAGPACPAPAGPSELLTLAQGCAAPWPGVLYTAQADAKVRADLAAVDRVCERLDDELDRCRASRVRLADTVAQRLPVIGAQLDTVADLLQAAPAPPAAERAGPAWPWAALTGGLSVAGLFTSQRLTDSPTLQITGAAAGAALGLGAAVLFDG